MSRKLTYVSDTETKNVEASLADIGTTLLDTNSAVTGMYGLAQKAALFFAGWGFANYQQTGSILGK